MEDARSWAVGLLSVLEGVQWEAVFRALSIPPGRRGGHCRTSSQLLGRGDLRPQAEVLASGFPTWRSPPVQLSGALSRRRRCRTSVSRLRLLQRQSCPWRELERGGGRGEHVTRPPSPRPPPRQSKCFPPLMRVGDGDAAPNPRGCIRGWAAETVPRPGRLKAGSGVAGHLTSSAFPEGARFSRAGLLRTGK